MISSTDSDRPARLRQKFLSWRDTVRVGAIPLIFGIPDLARAYVRLPFSTGLYRTETILMALNGVAAVVAFAAVVTRRSWEFWAFSIWLLLGTIRLLTVGNLR
jgi:hypothetical protein